MNHDHLGPLAQLQFAESNDMPLNEKMHMEVMEAVRAGLTWAIWLNDCDEEDSARLQALAVEMYAQEQHRRVTGRTRSAASKAGSAAASSLASAAPSPTASLDKKAELGNRPSMQAASLRKRSREVEEHEEEEEVIVVPHPQKQILETKKVRQEDQKQLPVFSMDCPLAMGAASPPPEASSQQMLVASYSSASFTADKKSYRFAPPLHTTVSPSLTPHSPKN